MDKKSPDAFRTISEVADWLGVPTHVLRFWESRFTQVKPVKRAGGRRYYRPADMELLGGIRKLLHEDGMTIRGVQKLLRENGIKHVAAMSPPLDSDELRDPDGSNVVSLTPAAVKPETGVEEQPAEPEETPEAAETSTSDQEVSEEIAPSEADPEPATAAQDKDSPPTLTDAPDEGAEQSATANTPEPEIADDLFAGHNETAPDGQNEPVSEPGVDPIAAAPVEVEVEDASHATAPADTHAQDAAPQDAMETPAAIDIAHIPSDTPDDAYAAAAHASVASKLRALKASGGALPGDAAYGMIARLKELSQRMPPAPSDDGRAE